MLAFTVALKGGSFSNNYLTKLAASFAHLLGGNLIDNLIVNSGKITPPQVVIEEKPSYPIYDTDGFQFRFMYC